MDKDLIERYKNEMRKMNKRAVPVQAKSVASVPNVTKNDESGKLTAVVTTLRRTFPVKNAKITVFSGALSNMNVIDSAITDESGRTKEFILSAPNVSLSLNEANRERPYSLYNMLIEADGFRSNVHYNIPVFSGITSVQGSDMMLIETAGPNVLPQVFDEAQNYGL